MDQLKVINYSDRKETLQLAEVFQSVDVKFSLLNEKWEEVTMPAKCRDFLVDCVWSRYHKYPFSVWGFQYDFEKDPFDTNLTRICMRFPNVVVYDRFVKNWDKTRALINSATMTSDANCHQSRKQKLVVVHTNKIWTTDGWKLSLLSTILKLSCYKSFDEAKDPDINRWEKIKGVFPCLLSMVNCHTKFSLNMKPGHYCSKSDIHNNSGIVSQCENIVNQFKELMGK